MASADFPVRQEDTLFQPYRPNGEYGMWGYNGACVEQSIRADRVDMLDECIGRGWIDGDCKTFDNCGMVKHARRCGSENVVAHMLSLGWKDEAWSHGITVGPRRELRTQA